MEYTEIRIKVPTIWLDKIYDMRQELAEKLGHKVSQSAFIIELIRKAATGK